MNWIPVCTDSDLIPEGGIAALVHNTQIAIFNVAGELYAIDNHDPISGANVLSRGITGNIGDEPCVASPLYKQHFSLSSGRCLEDADVTIGCYPVRRQDGAIEVQLKA